MTTTLKALDLPATQPKAPRRSHRKEANPINKRNAQKPADLSGFLVQNSGGRHRRSGAASVANSCSLKSAIKELDDNKAKGNSKSDVGNNNNNNGDLSLFFANNPSRRNRGPASVAEYPVSRKTGSYAQSHSLLQNKTPATSSAVDQYPSLEKTKYEKSLGSWGGSFDCCIVNAKANNGPGGSCPEKSETKRRSKNLRNSVSSNEAKDEETVNEPIISGSKKSPRQKALDESLKRLKKTELDPEGVDFRDLKPLMTLVGLPLPPNKKVPPETKRKILEHTMEFFHRQKCLDEKDVNGSAFEAIINLARCSSSSREQAKSSTLSSGSSKPKRKGVNESNVINSTKVVSGAKDENNETQQSFTAPQEVSQQSGGSTNSGELLVAKNPPTENGSSSSKRNSGASGRRYRLHGRTSSNSETTSRPSRQSRTKESARKRHPSKRSCSTPPAEIRTIPDEVEASSSAPPAPADEPTPKTTPEDNNNNNPKRGRHSARIDDRKTPRKRCPSRSTSLPPAARKNSDDNNKTREQKDSPNNDKKTNKKRQSDSSYCKKAHNSSSDKSKTATTVADDLVDSDQAALLMNSTCSSTTTTQTNRSDNRGRRKERDDRSKQSKRTSSKRSSSMPPPKTAMRT